MDVCSIERYWAPTSYLDPCDDILKVVAGACTQWKEKGEFWSGSLPLLHQLPFFLHLNQSDSVMQVRIKNIVLIRI